MLDEINFLIYNPNNTNIRIRGIGYLNKGVVLYVLFETEEGNFIEEIKNPFHNSKDIKLFDEMIKKYKSDDIIISQILKNHKESLDYIIKRSGYNICIEPYDIFGEYS